MSTGANLENTSLSWLDKMDALGGGTVAAQNAVLATSVEQMLGDLRGTYQKIVKSDGKFGNYEAKQLQNRIENTTELLPPAARKRLTAIYERDLAVANELGKEAGVDLDKQLKERSEAQKANAAPNVPGQKAAGRRLRVFWEQENSKMTDRVRALTQQAALQGKSWRSLSLQIRELLIQEEKQGTESERSKRVNKRYGINGRAELIARTEMAAAFVQGKIDEMRRMGYEYARWSAAAERTCGYCMSRDGLVYKIEEVEGSIPAHPRCRCSLVPVEMSAEMKKNGPTGPGAADELDDAYWTKSRNDKLSQWKQENRGIRDPKTENLLNQMLRDYARTPTNTQNYLRPGSEAPKPFWAPSGTTIPDLGRASRNAEEASEAEGKARREELERESNEAMKAAEKEARRVAAAKKKEAQEAADKQAKETQRVQDALDKKEYAAVSKAFQDKGKIDFEKFKGLPKAQRDQLVNAANEKLAKGRQADDGDFQKAKQWDPQMTREQFDALSPRMRDAIVMKGRAQDKSPKWAVDGGVEGLWKLSTPAERATLEQTVKQRNAEKAELQKKVDEAKSGKGAKTSDKFKVDEHFLSSGVSKLKAKDLGDALDLIGELGGAEAAANIAKLKQWFNKNGTVVRLANPALDTKGVPSRSTREKLMKEWEDTVNDPNWKRAMEMGPKSFSKYGQERDLRAADKMIEETLKGDYMGARFNGGNRRALGWTKQGLNAVVVSDHKNSRPLSRERAKEMLDTLNKNAEYAKEYGKPREFTGISEHIHGWKGKHGKQGQTDDTWVYTVMHEMGHSVHFHGGTRAIDGTKAGADGSNAGRRIPNDERGAGNRKEFEISKYGNTDLQEAFAENFVLYLANPKLLKQASPQTYKWIDDHMNRGLE